jgi:glutathione peroxidase
MSAIISDTSIYQFTVTGITGETISLADFKGKLLLIVNTASGCGFAPQLKELQNLYTQFKGSGLEILACPSTDFGKQEPLTNEGIATFCKTTYEVNFPLTQKIHVKGAGAHPLYAYLANKTINPRSNGFPRWNFHKYLIGKEGRMIDYFYSFTRPQSVKLQKIITANL